MYDTFLNDEFGNLENKPKSSLEKLVENYEIGLEILKKIFFLPKNELINYLKELNNDDMYLEILKNNPKVIKITEDDCPDKIILNFYNSIIIKPFGITLKSEYGSERNLIEFNKFFNCGL